MKDQESRETIGSKSLESHTNRRTTIIAICIVMMFVMVSLTYRLNLNAGEIDMEPTTEELDEWYVHLLLLRICQNAPPGEMDGCYVSTDENFPCTPNGWTIINITGPPGLDGLNGSHGSDGISGEDGISTLINIVNATSCLNGGNTFEIGSDDNRDEILSIAEIRVTLDICNGAHGESGFDGNDGINGTDGSDGSNGLNSLVATSTELPGSNCANGGTRIDVGLDEDSDGILELDEIEQTQYVCQGVGSNNTILTSTSAPPLSMGCDAGLLHTDWTMVTVAESVQTEYSRVER